MIVLCAILPSQAITSLITNKVATPVFSPQSGTYTGYINVTIYCATIGATIRYSIINTATVSVSSTNSTVYTKPITVKANMTIAAWAYKDGMNASERAIATYKIIIPPSASRVATPTFSPQGGVYTGALRVSILCATPDATIRYTTGGSEPTSTSAVYTGPISVTGSMTLKARAFKAGMVDSQVATASYTILTPSPNATERVAKPVFSPSSGTFKDNVTVTITCATPGATIYVSSGSTIADSTSTSNSASSTALVVYTGPITLTNNYTLVARATKTGMANSETATASYTVIISPGVRVATPVFNPPSGTYNGAQKVTITCATSGATIYYSMGNTLTTSTSSSAIIKYTGPIAVTANTTITAKAYKDGMTESATATARYMIVTSSPTPTPTPTPSPTPTLSRVAKPAFSLPSGNYTGTQTLTISCATSGATIYYSLNPTSSSAVLQVYTGPITISSSTTIMAIAKKSGMTDSETATARYAIIAATNA
jgi:hypothetical protein